ncbi:peptidyl-prolyl cis-trans isomerase D [Nitrosomonas cryotolerans]|nr:peptidyl-prolyl cis-trans isomerase D [Nitrosomonas cryotolerans]
MFLAVLPFLFWGVESYRSDGGEGYVAIVDGKEISRREFEQALRDQQERMRSMFGSNFDSALLDNPQVRNSVLDRLIQQRLLHQEAVNNKFIVLNSQLVKVIRDIPEFQQNGVFSNQRYQELLQNQGVSPLIFESRVRQELLLQQLLDGYSENGFISKTAAKKALYLSEVKREISQVRINPSQFISQINPDEAAIESYYEEHRAEFYLPERVRIEYLVLSLDNLAENEPIDEDEIRSYFDEHQSEFGQPEERRASHILISVPADASGDERKAAEDKASEILEQIKQNPNDFADLAKQYSDDPGSANQDGDLGFFGRGAMVKAFEDEIFQMELDEIRGLVETDFGFHIIKLSAVKPTEVADFEAVEAQIAKNLKQQKIAVLFGEIAEDFSNIVYEQSDSLQPVAERFELSIHESDWIDRKIKEPSVLANEKLLAAIFSDDAIKDKRNTDAIEVEPDVFVSARILEHKVAAAQSLAIVKDEIIERLKQQIAVEMAMKEGEEKLAHLQAGENDVVTWTDTKEISYSQSQGVDYDILQSVFRIDGARLPAYVGISDSLGGYDLIRVNRIIEPDMEDEAKNEKFSEQLQEIMTQEELSSYLSGLRQRYDVTIKQDIIAN